MAEQPTPNGCRELKRGEPIEPGDVYWIYGDMENGLGTVGKLDKDEQYLPGMHAKHFRQITTQKPKETTMTKKPSTPAAKPAKVLPKYPKAREALTYGVTVTGKTTKESMKGLLDLTIEIHNGTLKDMATTGTKLDRALVDLKVARARIRLLESTIAKETV